MPEVVQSFVDNKDFNEVREIPRRILSAYEQDFSQYAPSEVVPRIRLLWQSIPSPLAKENKKFVYDVIKEGTRAKDYELALSWLIDCGLVHRVFHVTTPRLPLRAYEDLKAFKLFLLDEGTEVVPVEVKVEMNLKAKSLKTFYERFSPKHSIRTSMADYKQDDWLLNLPLWAVETVSRS